MEDIFRPEMGLWLIVWIVALYPLLAIGRIWFYSKQQVRLLKEIRDQLQAAAQKHNP